MRSLVLARSSAVRTSLRVSLYETDVYCDIVISSGPHYRLVSFSVLDNYLLPTDGFPSGLLLCLLKFLDTRTTVHARIWNQRVLLTLTIGVEYWTYLDPSSAATTKQCATVGEDPTCSDSVPFTGINPAHLVVCHISSLRYIFC